MYKIEVSPAAGRDLSKLEVRLKRSDFERLRNAIRNLAEEPRPAGVKKIRGTEIAYRIRIGNYRVIYEVYDRDNLIVIFQISRRTETTYR
jgi:mRNA interferase RelE/StbE